MHIYIIFLFHPGLHTGGNPGFFSRKSVIQGSTWLSAVLIVLVSTQPQKEL